MFIAKFLFSIDDRINKWLCECGRVKTVEEMSLELVDFVSMISDLKLNRYFCDLSDTIRIIAKEEENQTGPRSNPSKKRKTTGDNATNQPKVISNELMDEV